MERRIEDGNETTQTGRDCREAAAGTIGCPGELMLTVKGGRAEVSAPVVMWPFKQGDNAQRWRLAENGTIVITLNN
jgi:hypothetical protein